MVVNSLTLLLRRTRSCVLIRSLKKKCSSQRYNSPWESLTRFNTSTVSDFKNMLTTSGRNDRLPFRIWRNISTLWLGHHENEPARIWRNQLLRPNTLSASRISAADEKRAVGSCAKA